jgi:4-hydroxy-tetrahydrodipicolinate reductase
MPPVRRPVLVIGALGRMGERVRVALAEHPRLRLGAAVEAEGHPGLGRKLEDGVVVSDDLEAALGGCAVAIDFSTPAATLGALRAAAAAGVPFVTGTTGLSGDGRRELERLAARVAVVAAPNFSVAVNVLVHLVGEAARLLGPGYDAELVELHHRGKRDAPSGTALRLARAVAEARGRELDDVLVLERAGETGPRPEGAIGVQTLRGGDAAGEHSVLLVGEGERLELVHRAATRDHFARGALRAAEWVQGRPPGLYGMEDVLELAQRP